MKRRRVLEQVAYCEDIYGALITNNVVTRRDIMRCVRAGLVKSAGLCVMTDAGGFTLFPERWREGFQLTAAGRKLL